MVHLSVAGKQRTPHNAMLSFVQQKQEKREFMMNTSISRRQFLKASGLAAAGACAAGLLTGCGGSSSGSASGAASSGSGSSYTILYDSQPATLNYLTTGTDLEMVVGANCVDTLVEYDNKGVMREGLATSWDWDVDTLTWTFHLREENWVDCNGEVVAPVTAQDFVDALKYVLTPDYAASNVGLVTAYIAGADDYYNYHVYLNNANTGVVDDDGTTYTCLLYTSPSPRDTERSRMPSSA